MGKKSSLSIVVISILCILSLAFVLSLKRNKAIQEIVPLAISSASALSNESGEKNNFSAKSSPIRRPASFQESSSHLIIPSSLNGEFESNYYDEQSTSAAFISTLDEGKSPAPSLKKTPDFVQDDSVDDQYEDDDRLDDISYYPIPKYHDEEGQVPAGDFVDKVDEGPDSSSPDSNSSNDSDKTDETFLLFSNYSSGTYASALSIELYSSRSESMIYYCVGKWFGTSCSCNASVTSSNYFGSITIGAQDGLYCLNAFSLDLDGNRSQSEMLIYNIDKTNLTSPTFVNNKRTHYVQSSTWIKIDDSSSNQLISTGDKSVYDCADQALQDSPTVIELENQMLDPSRLDRSSVKNHVYDLATAGTCASMTVVVKDFEFYSFLSGQSSIDGFSGEITPYGSLTSDSDNSELVSGFMNVTGRY